MSVTARGDWRLPEETSTKPCVQLTCHFLSTVAFFPTREARPQAILKSIILFTVVRGSMALDKRREAMLLFYWNINCVSGRKMELKQVLRQQGVDVCLLNETRLEPVWPESSRKHEDLTVQISRKNKNKTVSISISQEAINTSRPHSPAEHLSSQIFRTQPNNLT